MKNAEAMPCITPHDQRNSILALSLFAVGSYCQEEGTIPIKTLDWYEKFDNNSLMLQQIGRIFTIPYSKRENQASKRNILLVIHSIFYRSFI
jgi:hypothetical protein